MSILAGIWNFDGEPADNEFLARISTDLAEYGPDGESSHLEGPMGMLYRPFHTTLESRVERQPHRSTSGSWITWDGRLDNRDELIPKLWRELTDDRTDVAIVAAALDRWKGDAFAKLTGDWALAVWNPRENELTLARDYMGIRQLFYYPSPKRVKWCSHLAPLALSGDRLSLCNEYIAGYLGFWPDAHLTPYCEIKSVPPGHFLRIRNGNVRVHPYQVFNPRLEIRYKTDAEYEEEFRQLLREAVRRRLRSASPVLAELSGGLDSSSIVCMADEILANESAPSTFVDTFSFYEPDDPDEDDFPHLRKVEERRGRSGYHVEVRAAHDSFSLEYPTFVATPGFGMRRELRSAVLEIIKRGNYRVVLAGNGGDELLGQAFDPRVQMADLLVQLRLTELAEHLIEWSLLFRRPWIQLLLETAMFLLPTAMRARMKRITKIDPWIDHRFARSWRPLRQRLEAAEGNWSWLPSVRDSYQTRATLARKMTHTIPFVAERRYPYLDRDLVEFLTSIPTNQLIRPGQRRFLMRRALVGLLPPEILSRQTKAGTSRSVVRTIGGHWNVLQNVVDSPLSSRLGYINRFGFQTALTQAKNGQTPKSILYLLRALSLELWLQDVVARGVISVQSAPKADVTDSPRSKNDSSSNPKERCIWNAAH